MLRRYQKLRRYLFWRNRYPTLLPTFGDAFDEAEWQDIELSVTNNEEPITVKRSGYVLVGDIMLSADGPRLYDCATCGDNILVDSEWTRASETPSPLPMFSPNWSPEDGQLESHIIVKKPESPGYYLIHFTDEGAGPTPLREKPP